MIKLQSISLQRGVQPLLKRANLTIYPQQKLGLIGANGSGKTSLFKLLLGELHEDSGSCDIPKHWSLAHMAQEIFESQVQAVDYVIDGDAELRQLEREIESASGETLAKLYERMDQVDGYTSVARAQKLLAGLGFKDSDGERIVAEFSGGWRIRLNLARALMCRSDLLLLDEPTNHLDLDACIWLEGWLKSYTGTLVVISHDRDFLDHIVEGIVHLDQGQLKSYSGNYSSFELQRAERLAQQLQAFEKQQHRVTEIENFVRRFRAKASKAKQAQSRLKELERMELIAPAHVDSPFTFRFPEPSKIPQTLLTLNDVSIGYAEPIIQAVQLTLLSGSRIGLLGHNGAGKSTLVKSLAGRCELLAGEMIVSADLRIGYYAQHQLETLDFSASAALHLQRLSPAATQQDIRNFLGSFGFQGDRAFECIEHFSGGEKARLALAMIAWQKPNLLLLDEPTNHLDLEVRHALTIALQAYEGALVLVSHDRHLLNNTVDSFLLVAEGQACAFDGDLSDYERMLSQRSSDGAVSTKKATNSTKKTLRQSAAARREKLKPMRIEVNKLEKRMQALQQELNTIETSLLDLGLYDDANKDKLRQHLLTQSSLKSRLEQIEEEWLVKSEALENA